MWWWQWWGWWWGDRIKAVRNRVYLKAAADENFKNRTLVECTSHLISDKGQQGVMGLEHFIDSLYVQRRLNRNVSKTKSNICSLEGNYPYKSKNFFHRHLRQPRSFLLGIFDWSQLPLFDPIEKNRKMSNVVVVPKELLYTFEVDTYYESHNLAR